MHHSLGGERQHDTVAVVLIFPVQILTEACFVVPVYVSPCGFDGSIIQSLEKNPRELVDVSNSPPKCCSNFIPPRAAFAGVKTH